MSHLTMHGCEVLIGALKNVKGCAKEGAIATLRNQYGGFHLNLGPFELRFGVLDVERGAAQGYQKRMFGMDDAVRAEKL